MKMILKDEMVQCEVNIGTVGHVDHGKTTLVEALSGQWTDRHSEEIRRGISIKLGYADTTIRKCPKCPPPKCFTTTYLAGGDTCPYCGSKLQVLRRVSFVDSPGHEILMATMLSGAALMDGAILVIAANEPCPQPQTREHFAALQIIGVKNIIIVQNKVELVSKEKALENYNQIKKFVEGTIAENAPIIPISAIHKVNLHPLIQAIEEIIPTPKRDPTKPTRFYIARSFDINKPGTRPDDLKGGVLGGAIIQGKLKIGDEIEIRPGLPVKKLRKIEYEPLFTEVTSLRAGPYVPLKEAGPGGLIGVGTKLDPSLTKADGLVGNIAGKPDTLPPVHDVLRIEVYLMERAVGTEDLKKVEEIKKNETLMLNVGTAVTVGIVTEAVKDEAEIQLRRPVCAEEGERVAISRNIGGRWRLIGHGVIK